MALPFAHDQDSRIVFSGFSPTKGDLRGGSVLTLDLEIPEALAD